jgi:uncharacterized membrane protein YgaE (UPF0421/DUF939 family)
MIHKRKEINFKNINFIKIIKIAFGSSFAIIFSNLLGLSYSASAGIITLLSIQDTKKQTLQVAKRRLIACLFAFLTAYVLFQTLGFYTYVFGIFLFIFITGSYLLGIEDGIAMCSVLVTHFLIEKNMRVSFIGNEILIMLIGTITGIVLNLFMPNNTKTIKENIDLVEEKMKNILHLISENILLESGNRVVYEEGKKILIKELNDLENTLLIGLSSAYEDLNNTLLSNTKYYIGYFTMRKEQVYYLTQIIEQIGLLTYTPRQAYLISDFIRKIQKQFHEHNNVIELLEELYSIKQKLKEESNPITREEFENRAILYIIFNDLECFLNLKKNFVRQLTQNDIKKYWNGIV